MSTVFTKENLSWVQCTKHSAVILMVMLSFSNLHAQDFSAHRWENRLLLLLTKDTQNEQYQRQMAALRAEAEGLEDRKLLIYTITPQQYQSGLDPQKRWEKLDPCLQKYHQSEARGEVVRGGL
ncbi:MAG: DUF4174 domain-containing protein, partial [Bacteroidota bacterium]